MPTLDDRAFRDEVREVLIRLSTPEAKAELERRAQASKERARAILREARVEPSFWTKTVTL